MTGRLRPPYFYPTPHGSPCGVLLLERAMFKFTPIEQLMVFNIMPISVNPDGSMSAVVSVGLIVNDTFTLVVPAPPPPRYEGVQVSRSKFR